MGNRKGKVRKIETIKKNTEKNTEKIKNSGFIYLKKNTYLCSKCENIMKIRKKLYSNLLYAEIV